jgi:diketogulonate reductase-like aldo/keto reductase
MVRGLNEWQNRRMFHMELVNHIEIPEIGLGVYKMEAGAEMNEAIGISIWLQIV